MNKAIAVTMAALLAGPAMAQDLNLSPEKIRVLECSATALIIGEDPDLRESTDVMAAVDQQVNVWLPRGITLWGGDMDAAASFMASLNDFMARTSAFVLNGVVKWENLYSTFASCGAVLAGEEGA